MLPPSQGQSSTPDTPGPPCNGEREGGSSPAYLRRPKMKALKRMLWLVSSGYWLTRL